VSIKLNNYKQTSNKVFVTLGIVCDLFYCYKKKSALYN